MLDTPVGEMFYKRTLSCYNFVVNDDRNANCYVWPETERKQGLPCNKYSNWTIFYVLFGKRHTENIADEIHSLTERENNITVYSPTD